jgi:hypothetical protein
MEEVKEDETKAASPKAEDKKPEQFVRVIVSDKVSILFPEKTSGNDIMAALTNLAGMFYTVRSDAKYKKFAENALHRAFTYVTSGQYEKMLEEKNKEKS